MLCGSARVNQWTFQSGSQPRVTHPFKGKGSEVPLCSQLSYGVVSGASSSAVLCLSESARWSHWSSVW